VRPDNTVLLFWYSAAAILAVVVLLGIRFARDLRDSPLWVRAAFFALALTLLVWSTLGFTLVFYSPHFSTHVRVALINCKWMFSGISLGIVISLTLNKLFQTKGLTNR